MGLMEAACFEFLPHAVRFIYKIDKIYADAPYSGVPFLQRTGTGYDILEALLLNAVFSPDGRPVLQAMQDMDYADEGNCVTATTAEINGITYKFYIDKSSGELVQSEGTHTDGGKVICRYSDFYTVSGSTFPHTILLTLDGAGSAVSLQFVLDRISMGDFMFTPRSISSSYDKLNAEKILKSLGNM
jgi:hypothetical protein